MNRRMGGACSMQRHANSPSNPRDSSQNSGVLNVSSRVWRPCRCSAPIQSVAGRQELSCRVCMTRMTLTLPPASSLSPCLSFCIFFLFGAERKRGFRGRRSFRISQGASVCTPFCRVRGTYARSWDMENGVTPPARPVASRRILAVLF
jgi:hypothetical protein